MAHRLPPDLERVGDDLTAAAARAVDRRARRRAQRRRLTLGVIAGALAFAALTPGSLGTAQRTPGPFEMLLAGAPHDAHGPRACDQPRGAHSALPACLAMAGGQYLPLPRPHRW